MGGAHSQAPGDAKLGKLSERPTATARLAVEEDPKASGTTQKTVGKPPPLPSGTALTVTPGKAANESGHPAAESSSAAEIAQAKTAREIVRPTALSPATEIAQTKTAKEFVRPNVMPSPETEIAQTKTAREFARPKPPSARDALTKTAKEFRQKLPFAGVAKTPTKGSNKAKKTKPLEEATAIEISEKKIERKDTIAKAAATAVEKSAKTAKEIKPPKPKPQDLPEPKKEPLAPKPPPIPQTPTEFAQAKLPAGTKGALSSGPPPAVVATKAPPATGQKPAGTPVATTAILQEAPSGTQVAPQAKGPQETKATSQPSATPAVGAKKEPKPSVLQAASGTPPETKAATQPSASPAVGAKKEPTDKKPTGSTSCQWNPSRSEGSIPTVCDASGWC
ncbi:hypothetical protein COOONC_20271 [Cooperia oncophora]